MGTCDIGYAKYVKEIIDQNVRMRGSLTSMQGGK